jgi:phosphoribosylformylglycinamidine synthase subunit PurQ / glutaminase
VRAPAGEPPDRELRDRGGRLSEVAPRIAVVVFPGSNDDHDAAWALTALGADPVLLWHGEDDLPEVDAVVLPGGFSYGDYLRCGAIARFSPAMQAVSAFAAEGGLVLGICNGFQILCEAGLLPGVLRPNASLEFVCADVRVTVQRADTSFTARCTEGQELVIPVKHGEGCYHAPDDLGEDQIAFRYAPDANPNGSERDIAGVLNQDENVLGLMPHPEHAVDPLLGSGDGALVLASLVDAARGRLYARA